MGYKLSDGIKELLPHPHSPKLSFVPQTFLHAGLQRLKLPLWQNKCAHSHHHLVGNARPGLYLLQLIEFCHLSFHCAGDVCCRGDIKTGKQVESWYSKKDPPPVLGSFCFHFAVILRTQHLRHGPAGSGLSDASKDCAHLRLPPRLLSAVGRQKLAVLAQKCWNVWKAIPKWQSNRWERWGPSVCHRRTKPEFQTKYTQEISHGTLLATTRTVFSA